MKAILKQEILPNKVEGLQCRLIVVLGISMILSACAAQPGDDTAGASLASNDENARECRYRMLTGSNIPKRDCRTRATWAAVDEAERQVVDEYKRQTTESSGVMVGPGGVTEPAWNR